MRIKKIVVHLIRTGDAGSAQELFSEEISLVAVHAWHGDDPGRIGSVTLKGNFLNLLLAVMGHQTHLWQADAAVYIVWVGLSACRAPAR